MKELKAITDSWRMIEKYNIAYEYSHETGRLFISETDYNQMLNNAKNKRYIQMLVKN